MEVQQAKSLQRVQSKPLKGWVVEHKMHTSILGQLILQQPDEIEASEFVAKVGDFLRLLKIETTQGR